MGGALSQTRQRVHDGMQSARAYTAPSIHSFFFFFLNKQGALNHSIRPEGVVAAEDCLAVFHLL